MTDPDCEKQKAEPWRGLLLAAAEEIERRGWCRNRLQNEHGCVCVHGALMIAHGGAPTPPDHDGGNAPNTPGFYEGDLAPATHAIAKVIESRRKPSHRSLVEEMFGGVALSQWNDMSRINDPYMKGAQNGQEVIEVLRTAAKINLKD